MSHPLDFYPSIGTHELPFDGVSLSTLTEIPKVDLHRHLVGSIRPEVLVYIANRLNITLNGFGNDPKRIARASVLSKPVPNGYEHFLRKRIWAGFKGIFSDPRGIHNAVYWGIADAARDGVIYVEFRVAPNSREFNPLLPLSLEEYIDAIRTGVKVARRDFPKTVAKIILSVGRSGVIERWGDLADRRRRFQKLAESTLTNRDIVVGLDLTGNEDRYSNDLFQDFCEIVKSAGIPLTVHSGETGNPKSVWEALDKLKVDRIGHGIGAVNDPELLATLAELRIPMEICPTSNIILSVARSFVDHPVKEFLEKGLCVTINTDDPVLLGPTTLSNEFLHLIKSGIITVESMGRITSQSISASFATEVEKSELTARVDDFFSGRPALTASLGHV